MLPTPYMLLLLLAAAMALLTAHTMLMPMPIHDHSPHTMGLPAVALRCMLWHLPARLNAAGTGTRCKKHAAYVVCARAAHATAPRQAPAPLARIPAAKVLLSFRSYLPGQCKGSDASGQHARALHGQRHRAVSRRARAGYVVRMRGDRDERHGEAGRVEDEARAAGAAHACRHRHRQMRSDSDQVAASYSVEFPKSGFCMCISISISLLLFFIGKRCGCPPVLAPILVNR